MEVRAYINASMKKRILFLTLLGTLIFSVSSAVQAQDVQLGLSVSDDGLKVTVYLISDPACSPSGSDGISQGTVTIRWPKGDTALESRFHFSQPM